MHLRRGEGGEAGVVEVEVFALPLVELIWSAADGLDTSLALPSIDCMLALASV